MANPQAENGHTDIANEVMEALCAMRIPGEQMQCLLFIIRKTWGWKKRADIISLSQFYKATGIVKTHVIRALKSLEERKLIITKKGNTNGKSYRFNKNYDQWKSLPKKVTLPKKVMSVTKKGNESLPKKVPTKETSTKETITKERMKNFIAPTRSEVVNYFLQKGYSQQAGEKAFDYYHEADWYDSRGNKVKNWKQKMIAVWFKPENKNGNKTSGNRLQDQNMEAAKQFLERDQYAQTG